MCDTGGARRTWLRGIEDVQKRYLTAAIAFNLGRIMRSLIGAGKPRHLAVLAERLFLARFATRMHFALIEWLVSRACRASRYQTAAPVAVA